MDELNKQINAAKAQYVKALGEVLREIGRVSEQARTLIEQDLANPEMSLNKCGEALYKYARAHKSGNSWACGVFGLDPDNEVVRFLLDFYKIPPEWIKGGAAEAPEPVQEDAPGGMIDLMELL